MKSLKSLCQEQLSKNFEKIPFFPEERLNKVAATALFDELPVSCADVVSKFVDSEAFFERACSQLCVLGCRTEEHGLCYKRMYFELKAQELFHTHENNLPRAKAEMIFMLKLACAQDFPLGEICAQLPNLNTLEIKYDLVASPRPEAYLECVPRAL